MKVWELLVLVPLVAAAQTGADAASPVTESNSHELTRLRQEVNDLKGKLKILEKKLSQLENKEKQPKAEAASEDDALEAELAAILEAPTQPAKGTSELRGRIVSLASRAFNPAISVNGLFTGAYLSRRDAWERLTGLEFDNGLNLQEIEARFTGDVDPFLRADLTIAFGHSGGAEVEEAFVKVMQLPGERLPSGLNLKAGKLLATFGRHNLLHTHQFPFIDPPIISHALFGEEGLNELGGEASYLLPLSWYSELTVAAFSGNNEILFAGADGDNQGAYLGHLKNFFDLGESTTLEIGQSYVAGRHFSPGNPWTHVIGSDLTLKWKPLSRAIYRTLLWQTEYLYARRDQEGDFDPDLGGIYSYLAYQFARTWWLQGRYDNLGFPSQDGTHRHRGTALIAFVPTEFSAIRLQYAYATGGRERNLQRIMLQLNYTMGSHQPTDTDDGAFSRRASG